MVKRRSCAECDSIDAAKSDHPKLLGWRKITSPVAACNASSNNAGCHFAQLTKFLIVEHVK